MAISRVAGQMLNTNLQRDGVNLSFSNLSNSTPVLYLDVSNTRVGINNSSPAYTLDVTGNINANNNITSATLSASGNITGGNVITNNVYSSSGTFSLYTTSNGNILLTPDGTGLSKAVGTNGFVIPAGNTSQRPGTPDTGTIRFNTQTVQTEIWDGAQWVSATGTTSAIVNQTISGADGNTFTFSLDYSATAESVIVTINGVVQTPTVAYSTDVGNLTITFTEAPAVSDIIQVRYIASTTVLAELLNGTSNVFIPNSGGNVTTTVGGVANVLNITSSGANVLGYANVSGNLTAGNISSTTLSASGNIASGNLTVTGNVSVTGTITGNVSATGNINGNLTGTLYTNAIVNSGSNATGNIGSSSGYFDTIFAKATSAQYADLAEWYAADADYAPGTVVKFGGSAEITICTDDADPCVAGVVSSNPSYTMNSGLVAEHRVCVALIGRVPCKVTGSGVAGAMMVSSKNGSAKAEKAPAMGTVIGKALRDFTDLDSTVEIVVGRL